MFGNYKMHPNSGVNPPYSPAYPVEWECALRTLEVMTRVDRKKVAALLADTPFDLVNDRVAFRFMASPGHTLAVHQGRMFDLMVTVPVRYEDLFTQTHIYMYCSDPMGIAAGRELFGYTKKDCTYRFDEAETGAIESAVIRRGVPLAEVSFTPDPAAPVVRLVDGAEQPGGEIHVRRLPHPERLETAYADVVYRRTPIAYSAPVPGRVSMTLHESAFDPLTALEPEVLSAQFMVSDVYGGGFAVEDRRLLKRLIP
ncbi:acetoacetate decarboxylase family protein [Xanthobacter sediminis]